MRLLPSIYFLWGRIFRSLSLLKSTVILIFFNLKNFHIIWAHQKCESSDLYCFKFILAILGLLSIHVNLMITSSMYVKRCWSLKLHWIHTHLDSIDISVICVLIHEHRMPFFLFRYFKFISTFLNSFQCTSLSHPCLSLFLSI